MKKYLGVLLIILVAGLVLFFFLRKSSVVGNREVLTEITRLEKLSLLDDNGKNNMTEKDLTILQNLVKKDKVASGQTEELVLLVKSGKADHISQSLSFLREYVETGDSTPCLPHELWHLGVFAENGYLDHAQEHVASLDATYKNWEKRVDQKRKNFPKYYIKLDALKAEIQEALQRLKQGDWSNETLTQLHEIGRKGLC